MSSCNKVDLGNCLAVDIGDYWNPTFAETTEVTDEDGNVTEAPRDFTGSTIRMRIRPALNDPDTLDLTEQPDDQTTGIYIPDKTSGTFQAVIMGADSSGITAGSYLYEISVTDSNGNEKVFLNGKIEFIQVF